MEKKNYKKFLETGDIILFSGDYIVSRFIEYFCKSIFSHCGIIIKNPSFLDKNLEDDIYVLESGYENINDPENSRKKYGVQLTKLDYIINNYNGKLYYRKLNCIRDNSFINKIYQIHSNVHNLSYDTNIIDWIKAEFNINIGDVQKTNTFWCSSLVAYFFVKVGFLDENIPWTLITPNEFSSTSNILKFKNCTLEINQILKN